LEGQRPFSIARSGAVSATSASHTTHCCEAIGSMYDKRTTAMLGCTRIRTDRSLDSCSPHGRTRRTASVLDTKRRESEPLIGMGAKRHF
jgi:hypothetical protein